MSENHQTMKLSFVIPYVLALVGMFIAHYLVFVYAPMESTMGAAQRIFYFHLPSAWLCYLGFIFCAVSSLLYLAKQDRKYDLFALASAEVALIFGVIVLTTGPLWARAAWGVWWKWEPRLTTMALLFLIFAAYWVIRSFGGESSAVKKFASILAIFGAPNIFFVHIAVTRWRGDHPNNIQLEPQMRVVLYSCLLIFIMVFALLIRLRYRVHAQDKQISALHAKFNRLQTKKI
jgi:heme exporter protein C